MKINKFVVFSFISFLFIIVLIGLNFQVSNDVEKSNSIKIEQSNNINNQQKITFDVASIMNSNWFYIILCTPMIFFMLKTLASIFRGGHT